MKYFKNESDKNLDHVLIYSFRIKILVFQIIVNNFFSFLINKQKITPEVSQQKVTLFYILLFVETYMVLTN